MVVEHWHRCADGRRRSGMNSDGIHWSETCGFRTTILFQVSSTAVLGTDLLVDSCSTAYGHCCSGRQLLMGHLL